MKVTFLIGSLTMGGAERQLVLLANGLKKIGHKVNIIVYYKGGELQKELEDAGIPVIALNKKGRWDIFRFTLDLIRNLRNLQPEILHSYMGANIVSILIRFFIPNTAIVWGVRASAIEFKNYHWSQYITHKIEILLSKSADLIITNSQAGYQHVTSNGFPTSKTITIPNGIDTNYFKPDVYSRRGIRSQWSIQEDETLIGIVARLDPMKDHKNFLNTASILLKHHNKIRFICIGEGPAEYKTLLRQYSSNLGLDNKILWAGAQKNMNDVYNGIDILCLSSSYGEGFPNVIAEAMSCNTACVATEVGDSILIIGETGVTVPAHSSTDLAAGIQEIMSDKKYKIKGLQRSRIINQFSLKNLIKKTEKALLQLL